MATIPELERRLASFPKGYISYKSIHGKKVAYLQYRAKGKIVSTYIRPNDLPIVIALLAERKKLEEEILRRREKEDKPLAKLSASAISLTGTLLSGDEAVAEFENNVLRWIDEDRAPLWVVRTHELSDWLSHRAIDRHRANSRLLKKLVRLEAKDDVGVSLSAHGATLTDDYWFRPKRSKLHYQDIAFTGDAYFHLALTGDSSHLRKKPLLSPEFTSIGSYEKAWKKEEDGWWMYKKEAPMELFSELFAAKLGERMGFPMAIYEQEGPFIKTKNFAGKANFEPAMSLLGDDEDYDSAFRAFWAIDPEIAKAYLRLIWFDSLVNNVDRHNENYGLLRERGSGRVLSLAPNFDNNLALFARGYPQDPLRKNDGLISFFAAFLKKNPVAQEAYNEWNIPPLEEEVILDIAKKIDIPVDLDYLKTYLLSGYRQLLSFWKR